MDKTHLSHRKLIGIAALVMAGLTTFAVGRSSDFRADVSGSCGAASVSTDTFIKTYRMRDRAEGYGVLSTKDGGYLVTGDTTWSSGMGVWNAFIVRTDAKGTALWSRQFGSQSAAQGVLTETKRLSVQTTDGNFVVAGDIIDFYDAAYEDRKEGWGDVLVTKVNTSGKVMWSTMVGDYSMDFPQKLWATSDGGVILLAKFKKTGFGEDVADFDAVPDYSAVIKFAADGKVQWSKKMNWTATDMEYLSDGSFIALAAIDPRAGGTDMATGTLPTVIKLDSKLKVAWARSIEAPSIGFAMPTGTSKATMKINQMTIRVPGGDFKSVEQTPDGGFIAFGRYLNAAQLLGGNAGAMIKSPTDPIATVAVKVNAQGVYQWARSVKTANGSLGLDLKAVKTSDGAFVIMHTVTRKAGSKNLADFAGNVEVMKVDSEMNPRWVKKIDLERDAAGFDLQPTKDGGVALSGRIITTEEHMIMGSMEPYEETLLIKADTNGNVSGAGVIADGGPVTAADQTSQLIMQNMSAGTEELKLPVNKKVKAVLSDIKDKERTIAAPVTTTVTPVCSTLSTGNSTTKVASSKAKTGSSTVRNRSSRKSSTSQPTAPVTAPTAATYPQINFDNAKEAQIETEKSRQIHAELLPILQKVFSEVKMTDNTSGLWLTYLFPRQATVADREAVQKALVALNYKVDEAEGGVLHVSKVGRSLRMTFSINNSMMGKLEVML
ncbi:MAG: hypothetical protein Q7S29_00465 [Candidatus Peribacter sp.]|nr:hypothetical protein [Candidatus Peribacter sp.]